MRACARDRLDPKTRSPIEELSPYGPYQSLNESMRTWRTGDGLDLVDFEHAQVRSPAMKAKTADRGPRKDAWAESAGRSHD